MGASPRSFAWVACVALLLGLAACGQPSDVSEETQTQQSALSLFTPFWDGISSPTQCNGMHCCPNGTVMTGAHLGQNVFQCAAPAVNFLGSSFVVFPVTRQGVYPSCPSGGWAMVGYNQSQQSITCQELAVQTSEVTDGPGQAFFGQATFVKNGQTYSTHVCHGGNGVMAGISSGTNIFLCGY